MLSGIEIGCYITIYFVSSSTNYFADFWKLAFHDLLVITICLNDNFTLPVFAIIDIYFLSLTLILHQLLLLISLSFLSIFSSDALVFARAHLLSH